MCIDTTSGQYHTFTGNGFSTRTNGYINTGLYIGVTCFTDCSDATVLDTDICLNNPPVIQNGSVSDDYINHISRGKLALPHAVTNDFTTAELYFLTINCAVFLHLDEE